MFQSPSRERPLRAAAKQRQTRRPHTPSALLRLLLPVSCGGFDFRRGPAGLGRALDLHVLRWQIRSVNCPGLWSILTTVLAVTFTVTVLAAFFPRLIVIVWAVESYDWKTPAMAFSLAAPFLPRRLRVRHAARTPPTRHDHPRHQPVPRFHSRFLRHGRGP